MRKSTVWLAAGLVLLGTAQAASAQGWRDRLKKAAQGVEKAAGDAGKKAGDVEKKAPDAAGEASGAAAQAEEVANVNYDFVPGSKVIFSENFAKDQVGDIPSRMKVVSGNWEVADYKGQRFLRSTSGGWVMIPLPANLPDKFTFEMDIIEAGGWDTDVWFLPDDYRLREKYNYAYFGFTGGIGDFKSNAGFPTENTLYHARLMADGEHVKVYENGKRVANVPEAKLGRSNGIWVHGNGDDGRPYYITNIRVAVSEKSLFDALNADGRVATHGILFATGSDKIQPASGPTLQEIGTMLQQHSDLNLTIEGHTDNVGQSAANLTLSQKRADAVKAYLVANFQVDASRLQTKGFGDTKPVASNATEDGKQQNRRVELVKN